MAFTPELPKRIVSLVPSITENLILFGLTPVGRTSFCIEPKDQVTSIPVVGGTKTLKISKIIALKPDLVIANKEENRKEDVEALTKAGLNVWLTYPITVKEGFELMKELSELCPHSDENKRILSECESALKKRIQFPVSKRARVITFIWKDPWMAVGGENYMSDMVKVAGGENPLEEHEGRYPQVTVDEVMALKPTLILLPSEPYEFKNEDREFWLQETSKNGLKTRVEFFSGEDLCWFGPRMARGLENLSKLTVVS